jgi:glutamate-1-semialdehyde 2,1-aminomutase
MTGVAQERLNALLQRETERFVETHPRSRKLHDRAQRSLVGGVPMQWMVEWAGAFPVFAKEARGTRIIDVDGNEYLDFCLGDTGAMFGHAPEPVAAAVAEQARRGFTFMLPTEDSILVAEQLARRFGLPFWQVAMTATDANRFVLRLAREITDRPKVLVFEGCYHGTVDETIATLRDGVVMSRAGNIGPQVDPRETTRIVEFNDLDALDRALSEGDVACVLAEPALTNHSGIVLPDPGFHQGLREMTRRHGALLIIDETHTISSGPGGYTAAHGLEPDMLTIGKPLAGGVPVAVYGMSQEVGEKVRQRTASPHRAVAGIGGTLTANALALHAMRVNLETVMTGENYARMFPLAERLADGVRQTIETCGLPWYVTQIGARVEYRFQPRPPRNGTEALQGVDHGLDRLIHLYFLNRGILVTPFHNMLLISPETTADDVDRHNAVFASCADELARRAA